MISRRKLDCELKRRFQARFILFDSFHEEIIIIMASLSTLSPNLIYYILDNLTPQHIFLSLWNVSTRLNLIINSYRPFQVHGQPSFEQRIVA